MKNLESIIAFFLAVFFLIVTIVCFVPHALYHKDILDTHLAHDFIHLITAVSFFIALNMSKPATLKLIRLNGIAYLIIGFIGFVTFGSQMEGNLEHIVASNSLNYLHFTIGLTLSIFGVILNNYQYKTRELI